MSFMDEAIPALSDTLRPPLVRGTADLTHFAYQGHDLDALRARIGPNTNEAAWAYDTSIALQLGFRRAEGLGLQDSALADRQVYRIGGASPGALRLLALACPGDLMTNAPVDFLTNHLNVRLDLLYVLPDRPLPVVVPDHDVAFFAAGEADPPTLDRLRRLFTRWPRPALNDPAFLSRMDRDALSRSLADVAGIRSPAALAFSRAELDANLAGGTPLPYPCLIRPTSSHAGAGLARVEGPEQLLDYLRFSFDRQFYITEFEDYRDPDGLYRKRRIAFIDRKPFLCHMAVSSHWMVHYLNAGMTESAEKRAEEARAMADFDLGFACRHAAAFDALHERLGFDYYSIDCAETRDGRLLVFEADSAAIIHLMDPPDIFAYKQAPMRRAFAAFEDMLRRRAEAAPG